MNDAEPKSRPSSARVDNQEGPTVAPPIDGGLKCYMLESADATQKNTASPTASCATMLRRKLDAAGARHLIVNRRGVGYALTTPNHNGNANGDGGRAA